MRVQQIYQQQQTRSLIQFAAGLMPSSGCDLITQLTLADEEKRVH